jgi:hypothetical protein
MAALTIAEAVPPTIAAKITASSNPPLWSTLQ